MYIPRKLDLKDILAHKSCFLFGPRQTGKSSLIRQTLPGVRGYNLLDHNDFISLSQNPKLLEQGIQTSDKVIVVDEIQKLPHLLDEVHLIIEKYGIHFLLTGSSARKLRRGGVNLLGGRARSRTLHPFSYCELGADFDLIRALKIGCLPSIYFSDSPEEDLRAYVHDYLREEIASEALVRNIPAFSRFLQVAALCNAQMINYTKIANDAQVAKTTVQDYFQILKDTLIAVELPAYKRTLKRKPVMTSKFYFFDTGVVRSLQQQRDLFPKSMAFGEALETYIAHELHAYCDYTPGMSLHYWRSVSGYEVDFVLNEQIAIEVKSTEHVREVDLKGLHALHEEGGITHRIMVCCEGRPRVLADVHILPVRDFLEALWCVGGIQRAIAL